MCVCVGEIDVKKGGGNLGAEIWGGKWGGIGSAPPLKNTMPLRGGGTFSETVWYGRKQIFGWSW